MWCGADNQKRCDCGDCKDQYPIRDIEGPSLIRPERLEKMLFLDQPQRSYCELDICRSSPDRSHNCKCDVSLDISSICHGVVEQDGHDAGVEDHQRDVARQLPPLESMAECERQLGQQFRVCEIVGLQRAAAPLEFLSSSCSTVIVCQAICLVEVAITVTVGGLPSIRGRLSWRGYSRWRGRLVSNLVEGYSSIVDRT